MIYYSNIMMLSMKVFSKNKKKARFCSASPTSYEFIFRFGRI
uniref:Uncharacterized protein n=1 Tax=Romanomermis culicivorax TaxID=13658 RepID=A0A915KK15_ROMCU